MKNRVKQFPILPTNYVGFDNCFSPPLKTSSILHQNNIKDEHLISISDGTLIFK